MSNFAHFSKPKFVGLHKEVLMTVDIMEMFRQFWLLFFPEQQLISREDALRHCRDVGQGMFALDAAPETQEGYQDKVAEVYGSYENADYHVETFMRIVAAIHAGKELYRHLVSIGCGPGSIELFLLSTHVVEQVTLVDMSAGMLERAQAIAEQLGVADRVTFIQARGEEVELPAGGCDLAFTINSMHWSDQWGKWVDALHRSLEMNGRVFVSCSLQHPQSRIEEDVLKRYMSRRFKVLGSDWMFPDMTDDSGRVLRSTRYFITGRKRPKQAHQKPKPKKKKSKKKRR